MVFRVGVNKRAGIGGLESFGPPRKFEVGEGSGTINGLFCVRGFTRSRALEEKVVFRAVGATGLGFGNNLATVVDNIGAFTAF